MPLQDFHPAVAAWFERALAEGLLADGGEAAVMPSTTELLELMRG